MLSSGEESPRESELVRSVISRDGTMLCGGSRVLQHLSDHHQHTSIGLGLGFCGAKIVQLSSFFLRPSQAMANGHFSHKLHQRMISYSGFHCRTSGEIPILHNCFRLFSTPRFEILLLFRFLLRILEYSFAIFDDMM